MESLILLIKTIAITTVIFLIPYIPLEKLTQNKPWYYRGIGLMIIALIPFAYGVASQATLCNQIRGKGGTGVDCGLGHLPEAFILGSFFILMGLIWLIKEKFFSTSPNN